MKISRILRRWKYIDDDQGRFHEYVGEGPQFPIYIHRPEYSDENLPPEWNKRIPAFQTFQKKCP